MCGYEEGEDDADDAVHGEEGGVEFAEVGGFDEGMFVEQEQHDGDDAGEGEFAEGEGGEQGDEKDQHDEMEGARDPESGGDADVAGGGGGSGGAGEIEILAGGEEIESGDPEGNGGGEQKDARVEGAAHGDPCSGRSDAESEAENEMGQTGEALCVGVEQQHGECDGREPKGEAIQLRGGQDEDGAGYDDEGGHERGRELSGGEGAGAGAGIGGVDGGVGEAIEGHGGGAGGEHGDDDPEELVSGGKAGGGEHGSAESEGESEDGVLPLDHFQGDAEVVEDVHRKIVRQESG